MGGIRQDVAQPYGATVHSKMKIKVKVLGDRTIRFGQIGNFEGLVGCRLAVRVACGCGGLVLAVVVSRHWRELVPSLND